MLIRVVWGSGMRLAAAIQALVLSIGAASLSGCLTTGAIQNRGTNINEGLGAMQNRAILLNLARASRHEPLYFSSINWVQAQGAADLKLAAPVIPTGVGLTAAQKALTWDAGGSTFFDNSTNTNFQMGVYSTQAFYSGMLTPLGLTEVDLLLHQGFPRELVFYLVIDKLKLTNVKTGDSVIVYNDPSNKASYDQFVQAVKSAMVHGLTTEVPAKSDSADASPPSTGAAPTPITIKTPPPPEPQLCFEKTLATADSMTEFAKLAHEGKPPDFCGSGARSRAKSQVTVRLFDQDTKVEVTTRSVYGLFRYLGQLMNSDSARPELVDYGVPFETTPSGPLLMVDAPTGMESCFSALRYEGRDYCVPQEGSQNTRDIFNILSLLVALKQSPGDLPATTTLLVAP
jgi:hypothetical protein